MSTPCVNVPVDSGAAPHSWEPEAQLCTQAPDLVPGELVVARNRKFNGKAHWVTPGRYLGEDQFGWWVFQSAGSFISRPGAAFFAAGHCVQLISREGTWVGSFYEEGSDSRVRIYLDLATELSFRRIRPAVTEFHMIDMDLDVVRLRDGSSYLDDEDEFALHGQQMNYPAELVELMQSTADRLLDQVRNRQAPFDGTGSQWLDFGAAHYSPQPGSEETQR